MCQSWYRSILRHVERTPTARATLDRRWAEQECSKYPLQPNMYGPCPELRVLNGDSYYRNILRLKADELDVVLGVDNGNIEIYDRRTLRIK